jgi:hypothetical protein
MRVETINAIYEDTFNNLVVKPGVVSRRLVYECSCGEAGLHNMQLFSIKNSPSYQYSYICGCGNKIKVFVKDVHFKEGLN